MRPACSGFTMIEVLVALLLVGTGALAMAMLQLQTLRGSREAAQQAQAAALAQELAELRLAWRDAAPDGADPYLFSADAAPSAVGDCAAGCDAAGFARANVAEWQARLFATLPGARAVVCRDGTPSGWRCDHDPAAPVTIKLGWRIGGAASDASPLLVLAIGH